MPVDPPPPPPHTHTLTRAEAMYRVALPDRLVEAPDSCLAPNLVAGGRATYYTAVGTPGVGAWVLATEGSSWWVAGACVCVWGGGGCC